MITQEFTKEFANIIEVEVSNLTHNFNIQTDSAWDSLAFLSTITLVDKFYGVRLNTEKLENVVYFSDLLTLLKVKE